MKKIIGLTIAALLIIGIVGAGTFAYFSDTATSTGNTFTAGTLVLSEVTSGSATSTSFVVTPAGINGSVQFGLTSPIVPGSAGTITWTLQNTGNIPGTLTMPAGASPLTNVSFNENPPENAPEHAADPTDAIGLGQKLLVWVTRFDGTTTTDVIGTTGTYVAMSGLSALSSESNIMTAGGSLVYVLHWQVPAASVGNEIQGDTANLDISFHLEQIH
jgi:predicted ribosomally synthesized peptide with SipW-like signal peptide